MGSVSIYMSPQILAYYSGLALMMGGAMGSFLHCAAWRIVRGESFVRGRSRCPECGHTLGVPDLIPIFSWILLRGRCRWCGARIPARYALAECFFALLSALCLLRFDLTVLCLRNYIFLCCLFCLSLVDWENMTIPDGALVTAAAAWAAGSPFLGWRTALGGIAAGLGYGIALLGLSLVMDRILGRESLGGGDIKLFAVVGLYLGPVGTLFAVLLSCVAGLIPALAAGRGQAFPFGPVISFSAAGMLLYGEPLTRWYLGLLGL